MVLVCSELISGSSTVGNASQAYSLGISSVWAYVGMCLGGILFSQLLCKFYVKDTEIAEDMLQHIYKVADGSVRRIVVNLALVEEAARTEGRKRVTLDDWGGRAFYTGEAPKRGR